MPREFSMPGGAAPTEDQPVNGNAGAPEETPQVGGCLLFYDTETTGLPLFHEPSEDPRQPHIVQLAATLVDEVSRATIASIDLIIYPEDWDIPEEVAKIHGITTEFACSVGVPERLAIGILYRMWQTAKYRVAHNEAFDARMVRIALKRFPSAGDADTWKAGAAECTQVLSTPILKLPPTEKMKRAGRTHHKSANLGEAFKHFTGQELDGAHRAIVDVLACQEVYFAIQDIEVKK